MKYGGRLLNQLDDFTKGRKMASHHVYSWDDLDKKVADKKINYRDILTVADQIRSEGRIGRMKFDYLAGVPVAFWTFDRMHFERVEAALDDAKVLREEKTRVQNAKANGWLKDVL